MDQPETTPRRLTFVQLLSQTILSMIGWKIIGQFPSIEKYVVVGSPHTTNWDFLFMLLLRGVTGVNLRFIGKDSLFRWPMGALMRKLGGIPVNRQMRSNFVEQMVTLFTQQEQLILAIAPEGTREKSQAWKSGFYYMALGAEVPIVLVSVDYSTRQIEIGPLIWPSGDIAKDFVLIRNFYEGKKGMYPSRQGEIRVQ